MIMDFWVKQPGHDRTGRLRKLIYFSVQGFFYKNETKYFILLTVKLSINDFVPLPYTHKVQFSAVLANVLLLYRFK